MVAVIRDAVKIYLYILSSASCMVVPCVTEIEPFVSTAEALLASQCPDPLQVVTGGSLEHINSCKMAQPVVIFFF